MFKLGFTYFLPYQARWKNDPSPLRICVKSRQVGLSYVDAYDSVFKAAVRRGKDVWIMSRDEIQSQQYFLHCKRWARVLGHAARDLGEQIFTQANGKPVKVRVLTFASGASIYALGEHGHPRMDTSEHVFFQNDQLAVRFIEEIDFDYAASDATAALLTAAS